MSTQNPADTIKQPNIKSRAFALTATGTPLRINAIGTFVHVDTADAGFEISFDGTNYNPTHEGVTLQSTHPFDSLYLRAQTAVGGILIFGDGSISHFSRTGGGGVNPSAPSPLMPYDTPAALGNTRTADYQTGVYAIVITGAPPAAETWQLRAWTGAEPPETDLPNGLLVPADYSPANQRVWRRS